jgi:D-3-phosphoglycerate dehydrogenase
VLGSAGQADDEIGLVSGRNGCQVSHRFRINIEEATMLIAIGPSSFAEADPAPLDILLRAGCEIRPNPFGRRLTEEEIIRQLDGVDGLIAGLEPLNAAVLASAPKLKALARVGIGMSNVDFGAAERHGVKVSSTPEAPSRAVAELTLAAALHLGRNLAPMSQAIHEGGWKKMISPGIDGSNVLIIGYGRIGQTTANLFRALGANILVHDPYLDDDIISQSATPVTLEAGLAAADIVSLHAGGEDTVIGAAQFALIQQGAILLNSARGGLVDQDALIVALDADRLGGVWFDTFWTEPYTGPLQGRANVLLTPHAATYTARCRKDMESQASLNLLRDLGLTAR